MVDPNLGSSSGGSLKKVTVEEHNQALFSSFMSIKSGNTEVHVSSVSLFLFTKESNQTLFSSAMSINSELRRHILPFFCVSLSVSLSLSLYLVVFMYLYLYLSGRAIKPYSSA